MNAMKTLTTGLFYPAMVGTAFVQIVLHVSQYTEVEQPLADLALWLGVVLLVFFSACFVRTHEVDDQNYSVGTFVHDIVEVLCIFGAFLSLRLFDPSVPIIKTPNYFIYYILLAATVVVQWSWSKYTNAGSASRKLTGLRIAFILGFTVAAIASTATPAVDHLHAFFLLFLAFNVAVYIWSTRGGA